tara:strand:+ start:1842 stop:2363 length:522 start_codon:yes stop_codon:yes gene_type:complete
MTATELKPAGPTWTQTLLVLKAILLGRSLQSRSSIVRAQIREAVAQTAAKVGTKSWHRQLFYRLLEAEFCRDDDTCIAVRRAAKSLSGNSGVFELYMRAHGATKPRKSLHGIQHCVIAAENTSGISVAETIMAAVGICDEDLSDANDRFLYNTTLDALLKKHGVIYVVDGSGE